MTALIIRMRQKQAPSQYFIHFIFYSIFVLVSPDYLFKNLLFSKIDFRTLAKCLFLSREKKNEQAKKLSTQFIRFFLFFSLIFLFSSKPNLICNVWQSILITFNHKILFHHFRFFFYIIQVICFYLNTIQRIKSAL